MTTPTHNPLSDLFGAPVEPTAIELATLHTRLTAQAEEAGLLDVAYRTLDTLVGPLLLAATPIGVVRVAYEREGLDTVLEALAAKISPRLLHAPGRLDNAARQLEEYFDRRRLRFELPLDMRLSSGFRRTVLGYLPHIGYGRRVTYQSVAAAVDNPKAVRAVGTACATNPLPLLIPCHRVIRANGLVGAYLGGTDAKIRLLELEAAS